MIIIILTYRDYGDIIYHKYDPQMHLNFTQRGDLNRLSIALPLR